MPYFLQKENEQENQKLDKMTAKLKKYLTEGMLLFIISKYF